MKTPIQKAIEFAKRLDISRDEKAEFVEFLESLLEEEKEHFVAAWVKGNEEGWEQNTDWPEHGERYFNERFGVKATDAPTTGATHSAAVRGRGVMRFFYPGKFKKMNTYTVTGTFHGSIVYANSEGDARRAFHKHYNGESIVHIRLVSCYPA